MRKYLFLIAASLALIASPAGADWTGKDAAGNTITFSNSVDCTSGTCIPIAALVNAAGATLYGTAGSSNASVLSVQGIASGTALPISGTVTATPTGTQAVSIASGQVASGSFSSGAFASGSYASGAFAAGSMVDLLTVIGTKNNGTAASNSLLAGGVYNSTPLTLSNTQQSSLQLTSAGYLQVNVANTNSNGQATMANSSPVAIASDQSAITVTSSGPYPVGAVPYTATNTGTTGATTATLAGALSVTTYICGFSIRANATAAATGNATVTGVITATMNFTQWTAPLASGIGVTEMIFSPCIPASGTNQSVAVVSAAPGSGGTVSVTAWGYKL